ncbi:MAG: hypothetical protein NWE92_11935 [Candidatus Bathyarchaeota archaeon]|nr:hypothetical protein [Candidatus Bathyarchaeota archaeon]
MHHKLIFALGAVFLVVAMVIPPIILVYQQEADINNYVIVQDPTGKQTNGNISVQLPPEFQQAHRTNLILLAAVELVFVTLFVITMYFGIRHTHPSHEP